MRKLKARKIIDIRILTMVLYLIKRYRFFVIS